MSEIKKLNLGSGDDGREGYINIDFNSITKPDVNHDLNKFPYPFEGNTFDEVIAFHILEHLDKPFQVMGELHRILKPGGKLTIKVPHFSRGFTHAEHASGFDITFPYYFNPHFTKSGYFGVDFQHEKTTLRWMVFFHLLEYMKVSGVVVLILKTVNLFINFLAKLSPRFCSRIWCFWVGGFEEIEFKFTCKKESAYQ